MLIDLLNIQYSVTIKLQFVKKKKKKEEEEEEEKEQKISIQA